MPPKSPLPMLIHRAQLVVDERQMELAELIRQEEAAQQAIVQHDQLRREEEDALPDRPPEARLTFSDWSRQSSKNRLRLVDLHGKLQRACSAARDALQEAAADLKRLELANEARLKEERRAQTRKIEARAEETEMIRRNMPD